MKTSISDVQRLVAQILEDSGFFITEQYGADQIGITTEDESEFLLVIED
jgi:hypothetical protein